MFAAEHLKAIIAKYLVSDEFEQTQPQLF